MNELVIEINNLSKKYRNILAVKNINFKIDVNFYNVQKLVFYFLHCNI